MFMKFLREVDLGTRNNPLHFGTVPDLDLDAGSVFPLFQHQEIGLFDIKQHYILRKMWTDFTIWGLSLIHI